MATLSSDMAPHHRLPTVTLGADPETADAVIVAVHGRDQGPDALIEHLIDPLMAAVDDAIKIAVLLPEASDGRWYPERYNAPVADNQPHLDEALGVLERIAIDELARVDASRVMWVGFSQGACLVAEFLARRPRRWGAAAILTGGRIGPDDMEFVIDGDLASTPVYFGVGRNDDWVSLQRVIDTADAFAVAGAVVSVDEFDDAEHVIRDTEIERIARQLVALG